MKKTIREILCMAAFAVLAVSCQKEIEEVEPLTGVKNTIEISVNGLMGEYTQVDATKSSLVNTVRVSWEKDDTVYVYDGTKYLGSLIASLDGTEDRYAILSGSIVAPSSGNTLYLVHCPLLACRPDITDGKLSISLAEQTTDKAPFVVYATMDYTEGQTSIEGLIVPFSFATSVIRVSCTGLKQDTAISSANVSSVNTSCILSLADGAVTASGADEGIITRLDAEGFEKVNAEGDASFQFAVPELSASASRILTIVQGEDEYVDNKFSKASIAPNYSVNTICSMVYMNNLIHGKFTVAEGKQVYFSKGNLQATYNGSSYSWGFAPNQYDIIGSGNEAIANPTNGTKLDLFGWSTLANDFGISTSADRDDYKGDFMDWGRALGSNVWRTLTSDEWKYLINERIVGDNEESGYGNTCVYASVKGIEGLIIFCDDYNGITSDLGSIPEGCVFLPAAGRRELNTSSETMTEYNKGYLCYWSATPASGTHAHDFLFEPGYEPGYEPSVIGSSTRNFGYAIRLVTGVN